MGIFDFFKKKKPVEIEVEPEKISFLEVGKWVDGKKQEIELKEKVVFSDVETAIDDFVSGLEVKLEILKGFDIDKKKAEERIKVLVVENLNKYMSYVDVFVKELGGIEDCGFEDLIKKVNKIFSDFDKGSYVFYERATFLIGDEIGNVKRDIFEFSKYFKKIFGENQNLLDDLKLINFVKLKLSEIDKVDLNLKKIDSDLDGFGEKVKERKGVEESVLEEIKSVKMSDVYLENLKVEKSIEMVEKNLKDDVLNLRDLIDFKRLSNDFHADARKMGIVKLHKTDFFVAIEKDGGKGILNLLDEAKLGSSAIFGKIQKINEKKSELARNRADLEEDSVVKLEEGVEKLKKEISGLEGEKIKSEKRKEGILSEREDIVGFVSEKVGELGGIVSSHI